MGESRCVTPQRHPHGRKRQRRLTPKAGVGAIYRCLAIAALNAQRQGLAFVLWGSYAQKKGTIIDTQKHLVLQSTHPSPLSSHRGFFGNHQFSKINEYLVSQGQTPIDWRV